MKNSSSSGNILFSFAWATGTALSVLLMIYKLKTPELLLAKNLSIWWMGKCVALTAIVQGMILSVRSWKLGLLWITANIIFGWIGFAVGFILFLFAIIHPFVSFGISGAGLGLIQWGVLRKYPRAYLMVPTTSLAWLINKICLLFLIRSSLELVPGFVTHKESKKFVKLMWI